MTSPRSKRPAGTARRTGPGSGSTGPRRATGAPPASQAPGLTQPRRRPAGPGTSPSRPGGNRGPLLIGAAVIVGAAILAIVVSMQRPGSGTPGASGASTIPPGAAASQQSSPAPSASTAASGDAAATQAPLPRFSPGPPDAAVGQVVPEVQGASFDGTPVAIRLDGRPKLLLFLAHWCSHCQAEVPVVQRWVAAGSVPAGLDLISVATGIDPRLPNYPPEAWLAREGWTVPVIVDESGGIAEAYGLSAFPYWVVVNADGTVARRLTGELAPAELDSLAASVATP